MDKINFHKITLRKFSVSMFIALLIIGSVFLLKHRALYVWFYLAGTVILLTGLLATNLLKPLYWLWMRLAFILGWINTRIILLIIFYLIFTPIGIAIKLFGVDLLERKIETERESYWQDISKGKSNLSSYERQF